MFFVKNEKIIDRFLRLTLSQILFLIAFFWVGGVTQILFYTLGFVFFFTALIGFCPLYTLFKIKHIEKETTKFSKKYFSLSILILLLIPFLGGYYSNFFTKKIFLEDYNRMNNYYKQTLFHTGKENREMSVENYEKLVLAYDKFLRKYSVYHPYVIQSDKQFNPDLILIQSKIQAAQTKIYAEDLKLFHLDLEEIRPVFQSILKRNGFSMLAVALVDFHDAMEKMIEAAAAKDAISLQNAYIEANLKLQEVETIENDTEIQAIRSNLDALLKLAQQNQLEFFSAKAEELKSSFVKVYLKRG